MSFPATDRNRIWKNAVLALSFIVGGCAGLLLSWSIMTYVISPLFNYVASGIFNIKFSSMFGIYLIDFTGYLIFIMIVISVINITIKLTKKIFLKEEET